MISQRILLSGVITGPRTGLARMSHTKSTSISSSGYPGCRFPLRRGSELEHGQAVCDRIIGSQWPAGAHHGIIWALSGLMDALETYQLAMSRAARYPVGIAELTDSRSAWRRALSMAAQNASERAAELDRLVPVTAMRAA